MQADASLCSITNQTQEGFTHHTRNDSDANIAARYGTKLYEHPKRIEETSDYVKIKRGKKHLLNYEKSWIDTTNQWSHDEIEAT